MIPDADCLGCDKESIYSDLGCDKESIYSDLGFDKESIQAIFQIYFTFDY